MMMMFFGVPACPSPEGVTAQPAINTANASRRLRHNLPVSSIDRIIMLFPSRVIFEYSSV
jgi:hypothetical protein